jgi:hypothetical protein
MNNLILVADNKRNITVDETMDVDDIVRQNLIKMRKTKDKFLSIEYLVNFLFIVCLRVCCNTVLIHFFECIINNDRMTDRHDRLFLYQNICLALNLTDK